MVRLLAIVVFSAFVGVTYPFVPKSFHSVSSISLHRQKRNTTPHPSFVSDTTSPLFGWTVLRAEIDGGAVEGENKNNEAGGEKTVLVDEESVGSEESKEKEGAGSDEAGDEGDSDEGDSDEGVSGDEASAEEDSVNEEEEAEKAALKEEIDALTKSIKTANEKLSLLKDEEKVYSKNGYAMLAADMQNFKKKRAETSKRMKSQEIAKVLRGFIGTYGMFSDIRSKWADDMAADDSINSLVNTYSALETNFLNEFTRLGAREYHAVQGEQMSAFRLKKEGEEHSGEVEKGCVIREVKHGWELDGEIIEKAACVISLGAENQDEKEGGVDGEGSGDGDGEENIAADVVDEGEEGEEEAGEEEREGDAS